MKTIYLLIAALCFSSCTNDASPNKDKADSAAIDAIDSSPIMNDSTKLPIDSTTTTVTH
jgi:hypothetical protein